jgi:drug/metabolite transporter (DMT)-like permease
MRLVLLTSLTLAAFAANSLLNRAGVAWGADPFSFGVVRLIAGALTLFVIAKARALPLTFKHSRRALGALSLLLYIFGFSAAYLGLDAGMGALILFGTVQVTMFAAAMLAREPIPVTRIIGALIATLGLVWLLWPGATARIDLWAGMVMACAGVGWGLYSLAGQGAKSPLAETAANFLIAALASIAILPFVGLPSDGALILAVISGALTSGLGYALWYLVLPQLGATRAAVTQTTVPVLVVIGGAIFLGEIPDAAALLPGFVVLAGVLISLLPQRKIGSNRS